MFESNGRSSTVQEAGRATNAQTACRLIEVGDEALTKQQTQCSSCVAILGDAYAASPEWHGSYTERGPVDSYCLNPGNVQNLTTWADHNQETVVVAADNANWYEVEPSVDLISQIP